MKNPQVLKLALFAATLSIAAPSVASAAAWTRAYAIDWYEAAMYFGGKTDSALEPASDCPTGANPEPDWTKVMVDAGYTPAESRWMRDPTNPTVSSIHGQNQMGYRGKDRANVYMQPETTPDQGLVEVQGKIAEGLNLDGDTRTGFISPTGEKGIDNQFYKALGCWKTYRGPTRLSKTAMQFNDAMREGAWTVVVVVSGKGADPMNDKDVQVGFYMSDDKLVKDGAGNIIPDYTYRIRPDQKLEATFKARTVKGEIISTKPSEEVWLRDPSYLRELQLLKAQIDLKMQPDGSLKGLIGGYRPWKAAYQGWVNGRGPIIEMLTWVKLPDVYYALKREADYSPTGPGGEKTHISYAMRISAIPAFVMRPDAATQVASVDSYRAHAPASVPFKGLSFSDHKIVVEGMTVAAGTKPAPLTQEQLRPPTSTAETSPSPASRGGAGD